MIVLRGRRRIGKSSLLEFVGKEYITFIEIIGLAPRDAMKNQDQLDNFGEHGKVFILLDEISWMASSDKDFVGKLKIAWDKYFSKNPQLILALCGSVSSWIDKNILNRTDFVGRISWSYKLGPLPINVASKFWRNYKISAQEKLKVLSITGGVPKYLEEVNPKYSAEDNIQRLCFSASGYLYNDFQKIFNDIFDRRATIYRKIVAALVHENLTPKDLARKINEAQNSDFSEYINDLEEADFIARDYNWDIKNGKQGKLSKLRIKDNYLRFYLKYIAPNSTRIEKKLFKFSGLSNLEGWNIIVGHLFEALVLENIQLLLDALGIARQEIIQYGPYFQTKTKLRDGCQIDLMILSKVKSIYVCEIKFKAKIGLGVIKEVEQKIERLKYPKNHSIRPVLIYCGELSEELKESDYFVKMFDFSSLI